MPVQISVNGYRVSPARVTLGTAGSVTDETLVFSSVSYTHLPVRRGQRGRRKLGCIVGLFSASCVSSIDRIMDWTPRVIAAPILSKVAPQLAPASLAAPDLSLIHIS